MAEESKLTVERLSALLGISDPDETVKVHLEFALENAEDTETTAISTRFRQGWKPRYCAWRWIFTGMSIWGVLIYHRRFLRCRSAIQQLLLGLPQRSSRKAL